MLVLLSDTMFRWCWQASGIKMARERIGLAGEPASDIFSSGWLAGALVDILAVVQGSMKEDSMKHGGSKAASEASSRARADMCLRAVGAALSGCAQL